MAFKLLDWTLEASATTGTGDYLLAGAVAPWIRFAAAGIADNDTIHLTVFDSNGKEEGLYTYHSGANSFSRTTIYRSTNGGAAVNRAAGTRYITCSALGDALQDFLTPGNTGFP